MNIVSLNPENLSLNNPCITIHLPTQPKLDTTFKTRDRIKLMRVLNKVERCLVANGVNKILIGRIVKPAMELIEDKKFWLNQQDSLVIFMAENFFEYYSLKEKTDLKILIDDHFNSVFLKTIKAKNPFNNPNPELKSIQRNFKRQTA